MNEAGLIAHTNEQNELVRETIRSEIVRLKIEERRVAQAASDAKDAWEAEASRLREIRLKREALEEWIS